MEGPAFMLLAMVEYKRNKRKAYPHNKQTYTHKPLRETKICRSISTAISNTISKVTKFHKARHHKSMSPALHVLYVPPNQSEAPQFVRLARKGLSRTVVFLHPNGERYELPKTGELKNFERDCGPSTNPVFGGKRACEGGCCAWFTIDAGEDEVLDYVQAGNEGERPKREMFLVRHGHVECSEKMFMEEGVEALRRGEGGGWLGRARLWS